MARNSKDVMINFCVSAHERTLIRVEAARLDVSIAEFFRRLVNAYLDAKGSPARILEHRPAGPPDAAQKIVLRLTRDRLLSKAGLDNFARAKSSSSGVVPPTPERQP